MLYADLTVGHRYKKVRLVGKLADVFCELPEEFDKQPKVMLLSFTHLQEVVSEVVRLIEEGPRNCPVVDFPREEPE
jgi:hypothetical protein